MSAPWLRNGSTSNASTNAKVWSEHISNDNRVYYWNSETKTASWEKPEALKSAEELAASRGGQASTPAGNDDDWKEYETPEGKKYYHNHTTGVTTWDKPEALLKLERQEKQKPAVRSTNGHAPTEDEIDEQAQQELERLDRIKVVGADGKAISAAMYALSDEAVPTFKTTELAEEAFYKMLRKTGVQPDWSWEQTIRAAIKDPVWRALPSARARKSAFEQYIVDLKKATLGKQKDRIEKLKQDFERMLRRHDEIKYFSQWHNIKHNLEGEVAYKAAIDEEERIAMFNTYVEKLEIEEHQAEIDTKAAARSAFSDLLQELPIDLTTTWQTTHEHIMSSNKIKKIKEDLQSKQFRLLDMLLSFEQYMKNLEKERTNLMRVKKAILRQEQRNNRRNFGNLLQEFKSSGQIYAGLYWKDALHLFKERPEYLNLVGQSGSSPMDIFWDFSDSMEQDLRDLKNIVRTVLDDKQQSVTLETTFEELAAWMQTDSQTSQIQERDLKSIFTSLQHKARQRAEDEKKSKERRVRRKQDDLRSAMKKLDPPIGLKDTYEDVRLRISMLAEFTALEAEDLRKEAFSKYIRRLKERIEDDEERSSRRDRHSHRHSPTRDRHSDRDRDRERRSSRDSRRSGNDDRDGHSIRRRHHHHREDRPLEADPRSPKRTKHDYRGTFERPQPADEPMLDYGGDVEEVKAITPAVMTDSVKHVANGTTESNTRTLVDVDKTMGDDASEDGEIAE